MTDKEKLDAIRAEIRRLIDRKDPNTYLGVSKIEAYKDVLSFIDSLQEESQVKESAETQHVNETCKENDDSLTQEPVSEDLEEVARKIATRHSHITGDTYYANDAWFFKKGAQWQKENLWKYADGEDLPEIGREVVAFQEIFPTDVDVPSFFKIVVAHRPNPEGYDGKSIATGEVEHYTPKTYGKGGWNIPDVRFWLDC